MQRCSIYSDKKGFINRNMKKLKEQKNRRPVKLIYRIVFPLPETKTVDNSFNILIRNPSKINQLLLPCVTITNLNRMFKVVIKNNKNATQNSLYICAACKLTFVIMNIVVLDEMALNNSMLCLMWRHRVLVMLRREKKNLLRRGVLRKNDQMRSLGNWY